MKQFEILLEDKPGQLAKLVSALSNVNIRNMTVTTHEGEGFARVITMDEDATHSTLIKNNFNFLEEEVILLGVKERSGELAKITHLLGNARINIEALYLIDRALFGLLVGKKDIKKTKTLLKNTIIDA